MDRITNPYRGTRRFQNGVPAPSVAAESVAALLAQCPAHHETPLINCKELASDVGVAGLFIKDERGRMGLGSFKALGAAYVIAVDAAAVGGDLRQSLNGRTYITASAGNHGMSVAAGAAIFGANAVIHIAETVPESFAARLSQKGATVVRAGPDYAASMALAQDSAAKNGWSLLSDSSWPGYVDPPHRLMEGYLQLAAEAAQQIPTAPTHILLQAGVGGMAGAIAAYARDVWGDAPIICVVEPTFAPAIIESIKAGKVVFADGPVSEMGRLDCKEPSMIAMEGLAHDADYFVTISEQEANSGAALLEQHDLATSPSGGAGVAALLIANGDFELTKDSIVLCILSEGPA